MCKITFSFCLFANNNLLLLILSICYADTFFEDIRENYTIEEICRRLQAMQVIT